MANLASFGDKIMLERMKDSIQQQPKGDQEEPELQRQDSPTNFLGEFDNANKSATKNSEGNLSFCNDDQFGEPVQAQNELNKVLEGANAK